MLSSTRSLLAVVLLLGGSSVQAQFQKWCGKYYQYDAPMPDHTDFMFPYPKTSDSPLLDFRCTPKSSYYLENDEQYDPPMMIIDANITHDVGSSYQASSGNLSVNVMLNGKVISSGSVAPGSTGTLMPLTLANLTTSGMPYNLTCSASIAGQTFSASSALQYKPTPPWGGTCGSKVDRLSGATLVRNATAGELEWHKLFPVGFFDEIGQNSTVNPALTPLDRLYQAHENGMNLIHVRPAFPPRDVMAAYLDTVESLGMYFTLDMSGSYSNRTYVEDMVNWLKNRSNLIGWYTGDEPDGSDPASNATQLAYQQINQLDGYHPVSVTLNCENYKFIEYGINGADQIRVDPYPVNVAAAFSRKYGTPCNSDYGCCGCDDCEGSMYDVIRRVDTVIDRSRLLGMYRTKQVWSVPQAFDDYAETFWIAAPDGNDVALQMVVALNHGASGITPFDAPGAPLVAFTNASMIANLVTKYNPFFTTNSAQRELVNTSLPYMGVNNIDVGCWKMKGANGADMALFVAANFYLSEQDFTLSQVQGKIMDVPFGNVTAVNGTAQFTMPGKSVAAVLMQL